MVPIRRVRHHERAVVLRWAENYHLFILGALSLALLISGARCPAALAPMARLHLTGMGASYVVMLTAFYVDNGKNLPLWKELPEIAFWLLPGAIGMPLILYALFGHPLVRDFDRSPADIAACNSGWASIIS